ncbi:MAG: hypothetical protein KKB02_10000 [Alphaproteobacteria bacterium]|nr:hypothetical protein [Alphaproteobacteria bacterium]
MRRSALRLTASRPGGLQGLAAGIRFKHAVFAGEVTLICERRLAALARVSLAGQLPQDPCRVDQGGAWPIRIATGALDPDLPLSDPLDPVAAACEPIAQSGALGLHGATAGQPD